jgi:hypothetical protein
VGCIEKGAGIRVGPGFYFYSGDDFYIFDGQQSTSLTKGKLKQILSQIPNNYQRAVTVSYNLQRNILIWNIPFYFSSINVYGFVSLTFSLDTGAWGQISQYGTTLINTAGVYSLAVPNTGGGSALIPYCSVNLTSDGTNIRPVFFAFSDQPYEFDPPSGTATNLGGNITWATGFNFCKTPQIIKDFMRCILEIKSVAGVNTPNGITLFFMSDGNIGTIRQVITGLQPRNGKIDVLLTGVAGESISVGVQASIGNSDTSPIEISGYLLYWQAMEDL